MSSLSTNASTYQSIGKAAVLAEGMIFENIEVRGRKRSFRVDRIDEDHILGQFQSTSKARISPANNPSTNSRPAVLELSSADVGGLTAQIEWINKVLKAYEDPLRVDDAWFTRPTGMLLHGPRGTGKTLILEKLAATSWGQIFRIEGSRSVSSVRKTFIEAKKHARSIIIIEQLESLAPKSGRNTVDTDIALTLGTEMRLLNTKPESPQVLVVGATNQISDVDESLRSPGPFEFEVEIPIPDRDARIEILKCLTKLPQNEPNTLLEKSGERTHGYTGSDLRTLLRIAKCEAADRRRGCSKRDATRLDGVNHNNQSDGHTQANKNARHGLIDQDIEKAMLRVRPSAMRELILEVPKVNWSDIGGQERVKRSLREAVDWPLRYPGRMKRLGIEPKKGLLLYGPPGCSKTLTAKALATEAGFNFIAVKGPELLSMYVGESERALRRVFEKARAASPSIIFFDEIDTIAGSRQGASQHGGLHSLETLLNEMDGIESLNGVFVLAATNKPDTLDLALLRPGRFDSILYVGPPDLEARREILAANLGRMDVAASVSVDGLAERTDGHSGAEMVDICKKAGYLAFAECVASGAELRISSAHFDQAMAQVQRQISPALRLKFEQWKVGGVESI